MFVSLPREPTLIRYLTSGIRASGSVKHTVQSQRGKRKESGFGSVFWSVAIRVLVPKPWLFVVSLSGLQERLLGFRVNPHLGSLVNLVFLFDCYSWPKMVKSLLKNSMERTLLGGKCK